MRLHLIYEPEAYEPYQVWVSLDHIAADELLTAGESFIVASGVTQEDALVHADTEWRNAWRRAYDAAYPPIAR